LVILVLLAGYPPWYLGRRDVVILVVLVLAVDLAAIAALGFVVVDALVMSDDVRE
jgi:hypothetical protein